MNRSSSILYTSGLLSLLTVCGSQHTDINEASGKNVTLHCIYETHNSCSIEITWVRCPMNGSNCCEKILISISQIMILRKSDRYQLLADSFSGNVSLSIRDVKENDSGNYACFVETATSFCFQRFTLKIAEGPPTTTQAPVTSTAPTEPQTTTGPPTTTQAPVTSTAPTEPQTTTGPPTTTQAPMTSTAPTETTRTLTSTAMDTHAAPVKTDSAAMLPSPVHPASFKGHSPASAPPPTSSPWRPIHENTEMLPTASTERKDATHPDFSEKWKDILRLSLWILLPGSAMFLVAVGLIKWRKIKASGSFNLFRQSNAFWQRQLWKKQEIQATYQRNQ
nr:T-cell immunoglobulin and mucin domain-containing protein 2-like isoform X7 [Paramormyrops kingsleyae]